MPCTRDAREQAHEIADFPVVLADRNDNTGGGSPGDSTGMLQAFLKAKLEDACILHLVDPDAIRQCHEAGTGASLTLELGGNADHRIDP